MKSCRILLSRNLLIHQFILDVNTLDPVNLYHITHYNNLESILLDGGLSAYTKVSDQQTDYTSIAHNNIQDRRATTVIPIYPNGYLHDYVPFYFAPRSPMLYAIDHGRVEGLEATQNPIIYFVTNTQKVQDSQTPFVFTDGHAIMFITEFYNALDDLDKIDWDVMKSKYWNDTLEDPDRKRRRQAEFLIHNFIGLEYLLGIGVRNQRIKEVVEEILKRYQVDLPVLIKPNYYF